MILTLSLAGFLLLLFVPKLGHWIGHIPLHLIVHKAEHSERFTLLLSFSIVALFVAVPTLLILRLPLLALDAFLLICILFKLLTCTQH